jgi:hypothetical protein
MPSRAAHAAERGTLTREAARRRAVDALRLAESIAGYGARQLADGLGQAEARSAALDVAGELETIAARLRTLARLDLDAAGRRALAVELAASGMSREKIADRLGVTGETARRYLRSR